jgi:LacI family transcriptional regulator, repressor for deo operon, udp, cdd, tsx, nupC, and nupG
MIVLLSSAMNCRALSSSVLPHRYTTPIADKLSSLSIDPRSDLGIAAQIRARIAFLAAEGELAPGERLPTVRALAAQLGVNVNTIRSAYAKLEADGLVRTRHGVGTVVLSGRVASSALPLGTNTVAVLIGGLNPFYLPLIGGIEDAAAEEGTLVVVSDTRDSLAVAERAVGRLIARGVDGIIAVSVGHVERETQGRVPPIVYVDQPHRTGHVLLFDGRGAGYAATHHLREHGHERIGIVTAPLAWPNVREVYEGYVEALEETGLRPSETLLAETSAFDIEAAGQALARLLDGPEPPTAVFAVDETLALGVLQEAKARGLNVPSDLAVAGYTDSPTAALVDPPLTMVSVPTREIGFRAMEILSKLMRGKKPRPRRTILGTELIVRQSCGAH